MYGVVDVHCVSLRCGTLRSMACLLLVVQREIVVLVPGKKALACKWRLGVIHRLLKWLDKCGRRAAGVVQRCHGTSGIVCRLRLPLHLLPVWTVLILNGLMLLT